ncbi:MAG: hypothetical protein IPK76_23020 [Lewinellaceae bacterium]|nr:hypothetical protein [Lewinellaceae bacterium]
MITIPATVARLSSRKDLSLSVTFDTGELSPDTAGQLFGMQNKAVYLALKETAFNAQEAEALDALDSEFIDDTKKTPSRRLRAVLYLLWQQDPEGYADFKAFYAAKMEAVIGHFKGKLV